MKAVIVFSLACGLAACGSTVRERLTSAQQKFLGRPITDRIAALGPPETVVRTSPTQVAYTFALHGQTVSGGNVTYTPSYFGGVYANRAPLSVTGTVCRATFVVRAPNDAMPIYQRVIEDVQSSDMCSFALLR